MANETLIIGNSNWAGKVGSLLGYFVDNASKYYARFITFSRNIAATYINSSGVVTTASANIPRIQSNALLLEPAKTNTIINNSFTTGWSFYGGSMSSNIYTENTSLDYHQINDSSTTGYSPNTYYCFSVILQKVSGEDRKALFQIQDNVTPSSGGIYSTQLNLQNGKIEGSQVIYGNWDILTTDVIFLPPQNLGASNNGKYLYYMVARCNDATFSGFRFAVLFYKNGTEYYNGSTGVSIQVSYPQVELGQFPTSRISTAGTSVTRLTDLISRSNLYSELMITSKGGTMLLELTNNYLIHGATSQQLLGIGNNTSGASANNIWLGVGDDSRASIYKQVGGSSSLVYATQYDNTKVAIRWDGSSIDVFENGLQYPADSFSPTQLQSLRTSTIENLIYIKQLSLYATPLNTATCVSYTNFDSSVLSFLAATGINDPIVINAINNLVLNYKGKGALNSSTDLWSKTYAIYPFAGINDSSNSYNLKNTTQYNLVFNGVWTFNDPQGVIPNGVDTYADTGLNPFIVLLANSGRFGLYIGSNVDESAYDMGSYESSATALESISSKNSGNFIASYGDSALSGSVSTPTSLGLFVANRNSSTITTAYRNGIEVISKPQTAYLPNNNLYIGALNNDGTPSDYSTKIFSFGLIGQGLTATESLLEYQIIQQFQKDLGRMM